MFKKRRTAGDIIEIAADALRRGNESLTICTGSFSEYITLHGMATQKDFETIRTQLNALENYLNIEFVPDSHTYAKYVKKAKVKK